MELRGYFNVAKPAPVKVAPTPVKVTAKPAAPVKAKPVPVSCKINTAQAGQAGKLCKNLCGGGKTTCGSSVPAMVASIPAPQHICTQQWGYCNSNETPWYEKDCFLDAVDFGGQSEGFNPCEGCLT